MQENRVPLNSCWFVRTQAPAPFTPFRSTSELPISVKKEKGMCIMLENLTGPQMGYIGGILGCILGFAGGAFGTYRSIKSTNGPLERKFTIKASIVGWIAVTVFLALLLSIPTPYRFLLWIPYGILLPIGIQYWNKRQAEIRTAESSPE